MKKNIIISLLALLPLLPAHAAATVVEYRVGDLYYQITTDSTASVRRYVGVVADADAATVEALFPARHYATRHAAAPLFAARHTHPALAALARLQAATVTIPAEVTIEGHTYTVDEIGRNAFSFLEDVAAVGIPATVTIIPPNAFAYCYGLRSIAVDADNPGYEADGGILMSKGGKSLVAFPCAYPADSYEVPATVTSVSEYSFAGGRVLRQLTWGKNVRTVATHTFDGHSALEQVVLPSGVTTISDNAFHGCTALRTIDIPATVRSLGRYVFEGCTALQCAAIGTGVTSLGIYLFYKCTSLETVTLPARLTSVGRYAFYGCTALHDIPLPATVKSIGENAFLGCAQLGDQTLPAALKTIGPYAFANCTGMGHVAIPQGVTSIGRNAFANCTSLEAITVEEGNANYRDADGVLFSADGRQLITYPAGRPDAAYHMPEGTTAVTIGAFARTTRLRSLVLPASLTAIGDNAFEDIRSLQTVAFPATLTTIGQKAFYYCTNLQVVCLPPSVQSVGKDAFVGCEAVEILRLPASLASMGANAFFCAEELPPGSDKQPKSALRAVVCDADVPPTVASVFVNYTNCRLFVPAASTEAYSSAETWKRFDSVAAITPGDVDFDGTASVADIMTTVGVVLGNGEGVYCPRAMDLDANGTVSVADVMQMVSHIMGGE